MPLILTLSTIFKDMIDSATPSDDPIDTELNSNTLVSVLDAFHIPPTRFRVDCVRLEQSIFADACFDFQEYEAVYKFAVKFECETLKPFLATAICERDPADDIIATLRLASRLNDIPLVCCAVENMTWEVFQAYGIPTMAAALRPEWQLPFLRCVLKHSPGTEATPPSDGTNTLAGRVPVRPQRDRSDIFESEGKKQTS